MIDLTEYYELIFFYNHRYQKLDSLFCCLRGRASRLSLLSVRTEIFYENDESETFFQGFQTLEKWPL